MFGVLFGIFGVLFRCLGCYSDVWGVIQTKPDDGYNGEQQHVAITDCTNLYMSKNVLFKNNQLHWIDL